MGYIPVTVTPTITAGAYGAGDVVGGVQEIPVNSYSGVIKQINVTDDNDVKAEITLYFFNAVPTAILDNAAYAPAIADLKKMVGLVVVAAANYTTVNGNAWAFKAGSAVDIGYALAESGVPKLYMYAVCTATPTYAAVTDLQFRFLIEPK